MTPGLFKWCTSLQLTQANLYSHYVLLLLLLAYLLNQLDRYILAIVTKPLAQEIHYGDKGCMKNEISNTGIGIDQFKCSQVGLEYECKAIIIENGTSGCKWDYTGDGFEYQILAGPIFIVIYTLSGIPIGITADAYNRKILLGISVVFWSICTALIGLVSNYWELVLLRFLLAFGQAGCTPFAVSLITDYFAENLRGAALGVYNWGIYTGYSLSFAVGNFITHSNFNDQSWRWTFIISGIPGIFLGFLIILTLKEPKRVECKDTQTRENSMDRNRTFSGIYSCFLQSSVLLLCLASSIRNAGVPAGYVWAYNTQLYFEGIGESRSQIGAYMSWIPLVAGSIGVVLGGFISDRFVKSSGLQGRIWVLAMSQILAAPFAAGALLFPAPWAYISLIPNYIIGEMWVGVTLVILIESVPSGIKTTCVAIYFFIITNIGGNMPVMVPILRNVFESFGYVGIDALRWSLLVLFPGEYVLASALFLLPLFILKRDVRYIQTNGIKTDSKVVDLDDMEMEDREMLAKSSS